MVGESYLNLLIIEPLLKPPSELVLSLTPFGLVVQVKLLLSILHSSVSAISGRNDLIIDLPELGGLRNPVIPDIFETKESGVPGVKLISFGIVVDLGGDSGKLITSWDFRFGFLFIYKIIIIIYTIGE